MTNRVALICAFVGALAVSTNGASQATAANIIDEWASVKAPPAPELKPVTVDPRTTALLMLDFVKQTCNTQRRPRCAGSIPAVEGLLTEVRKKGMMVVYTSIPNVGKTDIVSELAPVGDEPFVQGLLDKYVGTDLEKIFKNKGIETIITVGTAAHGAVIITASASAARGFKVILPVDGMSAESTYAEQYTAWHLKNAPVIANNVTLTKIDMIKF